jgi:hypothetical protein
MLLSALPDWDGNLIELMKDCVQLQGLVLVVLKLLLSECSLKTFYNKSFNYE